MENNLLNEQLKSQFEIYKEEIVNCIKNITKAN